MLLLNNKVVEMSINREELKRLIDFIHEEDVTELYDFIGYLNMKRERETFDYTDVDFLSKDKELIQQIQKSREDRENDRIYDKEQGLKYLQDKFEDSAKIDLENFIKRTEEIGRCTVQSIRLHSGPG